MLWTAGWLVYLLHVVAAFQFVHHWSHAEAAAATARRTSEVVGFSTPAGIYFNYLFTLVWLTIFSSGKARSDYLDPTRAGAFNKARGGSPSALLIDATGDMGHAYGAMTANHMFIIDRTGLLVYAGGVDDAESFDLKKVLKGRSYVRPALEDVLAGRPVKRATTDPAGCSIAYA